jgi:hypothetical protein
VKVNILQVLAEPAPACVACSPILRKGRRTSLPSGWLGSRAAQVLLVPKSPGWSAAWLHVAHQIPPGFASLMIGTQMQIFSIGAAQALAESGFGNPFAGFGISPARERQASRAILVRPMSPLVALAIMARRNFESNTGHLNMGI